MTLDRYRADFPWSTESLDRLRVLYDAHNTYKQCAAVIQAEFGGTVTTGSIAGKVDRAGLRIDGSGAKRPPRSPGNKGNGRPKLPPVTRIVMSRGKNNTYGDSVEMVDIPEIMDLPPDESPHAITITDLGEDHCRWPLGTPAHDMLYCGDGAMRGLPYCARHSRIAYRMPGQRA